MVTTAAYLVGAVDVATASTLVAGVASTSIMGWLTIRAKRAEQSGPLTQAQAWIALVREQRTELDQLRETVRGLQADRIVSDRREADCAARLQEVERQLGIHRAGHLSPPPNTKE